MSDILFMTVALLTGIALGILFFGGLWFTVRKAMEAKLPALWFFGSLILRIGIVLLGFYWVMQRDNWLDGLICLIGFVGARFIVIRLTKRYNDQLKLVKKEIKEVVNEA
jgi:F1F0 ATPase subunit 2